MGSVGRDEILYLFIDEWMGVVLADETGNNLPSLKEKIHLQWVSPILKDDNNVYKWSVKKRLKGYKRVTYVQMPFYRGKLQLFSSLHSMLDNWCNSSTEFSIDVGCFRRWLSLLWSIAKICDLRHQHVGLFTNACVVQVLCNCYFLDDEGCSLIEWVPEHNFCFKINSGLVYIMIA